MHYEYQAYSRNSSFMAKCFSFDHFLPLINVSSDRVAYLDSFTIDSLEAPACLSSFITDNDFVYERLMFWSMRLIYFWDKPQLSFEFWRWENNSLILCELGSCMYTFINKENWNQKIRSAHIVWIYKNQTYEKILPLIKSIKKYWKPIIHVHF